MDIIELERWKPSETDPRKLEYAGRLPAQEVFEELKHRLESTGYLPDEYFLMDDHWNNGHEVPKDADIFCTTAKMQQEAAEKMGSFMKMTF